MKQEQYSRHYPQTVEVRNKHYVGADSASLRTGWDGGLSSVVLLGNDEAALPVLPTQFGTQTEHLSLE